MKKPKQLKCQTIEKPVPTNWLEFINNEDFRLAIPVGPRFQAYVPDWTGPPHKNNRKRDSSEADTSRWLGSKAWPIIDGSSKRKGDVIGKGRPDSCLCVSPGSEECVKRHVTEKRIQLQSDLGPVFWRMKFDNMGEDVSKLWNLEEQKRFESLLKLNPKSQGKCFLKSALRCLPSQTRESIVSYYFNVHLPRRFSTQTRSGYRIVDTDDEDGEALSSKGSRKRCQADGVKTYNSKCVKARYLTGRR